MTGPKSEYEERVVGPAPTRYTELGSGTARAPRWAEPVVVHQDVDGASRAAIVPPAAEDSKPTKSWKTQWSHVGLDALEPIVAAFTHGINKGYEPMSWKLCPPGEVRARYGDALIRHACDWMAGKTEDEDSGCHPLAHVAACCVIILWHELPR